MTLPLKELLNRLPPQFHPSLRLSKLGALPNREAVTWACQGKGIPGWLYFTRNPTPMAYFINRTSEITPVRIVWDERCFEETIFRVEKTPTHLYLADVWMFNGTHVFDYTTFEERQARLKTLYSTFYTPCPPFESFCVQLRSELTDVRGKEYYTNERGAKGIFVEDKPSEDEAELDIVKTDIPDVYRIPSNGEYLSVKTLALSRYLRSFGPSFRLRCLNNKDGTWTPLLSSKPVTNEASS
jgi:hypothetical protein